MLLEKRKLSSSESNSRLGYPLAKISSGVIKILVLSCCFASNSFADGLDNTLDMIRNAPEDSWLKMNLNAFSSAWTPLALRPANDSSYANPATIIQAWSSFAWDSNRSQLLIYGGGHANYAGNDVYSWSASTQLWERVSLPSQLDANNIPVDGVDSAPESSHTYDNSVFLPVADRFVTFGGAAYQTGANFFGLNPDGSEYRVGPYFFDPSKADPNKVGGTTGSGVDVNTPGGNMWENRNDYANLPAGMILPGSVTGTTDYAYQNGKEVIYVSGPDGGGTEHMLASLTINDINDPTKDVWTILGFNQGGAGGQGAGAYDPVHNLYIRTSGPATQFTFWDLDKAGPSNGNVLVTLASAPADFDMNGNYGLEYDPVRKDFLLWGGGSSVYQLNVGNKDGTNWTVTKLDNAISAVTPAEAVTAGILGKWHYASDLDVFVGLEARGDGNVWFYKPTGWVDPLAAVPVPGAAYLMLSGLSFLLVSGKRKYR